MKILILVADGMIVDVLTDEGDDIEVAIADYDVPEQLTEQISVPLILFEDSSHEASLERIDTLFDADKVNAAFMALDMWHEDSIQ